MRTSHLINFSALLLLCCAMVGCGKDNPSTPTTKYGSIYGTVTDFATGDPVNNVNVRLNPRGETTLTGYDGSFQFEGITDGNYSLSLSKNGYMDLDDDYSIVIENGNNVRRDVQLRSQTTIVYGTVFNKVTHEPIIGAEVEIGRNNTTWHYHDADHCNKITSSVSGSDGQFRMQFGPLQQFDHFYIWASCSGYKEYYSPITINMGDAFPMDIILDPR